MEKYKFKFKDDAKPFTTSDFWYDIFDGGYFNPEIYFEPTSYEYLSFMNSYIFFMELKNALYEQDLVEEI